MPRLFAFCTVVPLVKNHTRTHRHTHVPSLPTYLPLMAENSHSPVPLPVMLDISSLVPPQLLPVVPPLRHSLCLQRRPPLTRASPRCPRPFRDAQSRRPCPGRGGVGGSVLKRRSGARSRGGGVGLELVACFGGVGVLYGRGARGGGEVRGRRGQREMGEGGRRCQTNLSGLKGEDGKVFALEHVQVDGAEDRLGELWPSDERKGEGSASRLDEHAQMETDIPSRGCRRRPSRLSLCVRDGSR